MKTSLFASVVFFYSALLLTMSGTPLLLHADDGAPHGAEVLVWDRLLAAKPVEQTEQQVLHLPLSDTPESSGSVRRAPVEQSIPDAAMINKPADKLRARTVKA